MPADSSLPIAFVLALAATALTTPAAIAVARRTAFYDHPTGYKRHRAPTPYLGGAAVVLGLLLGSVALGAGIGDVWAVLVAAVALLAVGTLDDRIGLTITPRLAVEVAAAALLFYEGFGWPAFGNEAAELLLTCVFVVAVINAYNLMDNLDGATPTIALVSAAAIAIYATVHGDNLVGAVAFALAGACAGFLPYNLAKPSARIFLGDGGSMAIGVTLAALLMSLPAVGEFGWELIPVMVVIVGLPAFDTALVTVSRIRRRVTVLSGARDHLTHRLFERLGSCRLVAVALAAGQVVLSGLAIALLSLAPGAAVAGAATLMAAAAILIAAMETSRRRVPRPAPREAALARAAAARDESPA
jgi:UDP-GlcNAc:undecaprenyl-phosphate/decaprenyl-phosphate GlcNAc-1-phosphate transferase